MSILLLMGGAKLGDLQGGSLKSEPVQRKWREHLAGGNNWEYHLWDVLMFQAWLREQG